MAVVNLIEGSSGSTYVTNSTITLVDNKAIDTLKCKVLPTLEVNINDEIKYYDENNIFIFGGYVKNISNGSMKALEVHDYGVQMIDRLINEVYRDMSPEAIIEDIINNKTDLTFNSNVTTNTTILKIVFKDLKIMDAIKQLTVLFGGNFRTDKNKNFYLETYSENLSNASLVEGRETNVSGWKINTDKQATKVIVKGAIVKTSTTEQITGTATEFTLTRKPNDVRVTVGGTELAQTVDGQIDGDYTVDIQKKKVKFNSAQTDPIFEYSYDSQIKVTAGNGDIQKEIVKTYIESMQEARSVARAYLSTYSEGVLSATFQTTTLDLTEFKPNYGIMVTDNVRTPNVNEMFYISKVVRKFPGTISVTVGEQEVNIFDWQKETQEKVKQLESKDDNADFIQVYEFIQDKLRVKFTLTITRAQYRSASTDNFTLNDPIRGMLNNATYLVKTSVGTGGWIDF